MNKKVKLTQEDLEKLKAAVLTAEKKTSGEIVPMIVPASSPYWWTHWSLGIFGWVLASCYFTFSPTAWAYPIWEIFLFQAGLFLLGFSFAHWAPMKRLMIPKWVAAYHVHRQSLASFMNQGLMETRDRTGVLIYLSLLERRVEIIADKGLNEKVPNHYWEGHVQSIVQAIHEGKSVEALQKVILETGSKLSEHFPIKEDDTNELENEVRIGFKNREEP